MLAFFDSFAGLVPVKIVSVTPNRAEATVVATATRGAYLRGDTWTASRRDIVARGAVIRRDFQFRIRSNVPNPLDVFAAQD